MVITIAPMEYYDMIYLEAARYGSRSIRDFLKQVTMTEITVSRFLAHSLCTAPPVQEKNVYWTSLHGKSATKATP